jgi:hypothetical protein
MIDHLEQITRDLTAANLSPTTGQRVPCPPPSLAFPLSFFLCIFPSIVIALSFSPNSIFVFKLKIDKFMSYSKS